MRHLPKAAVACRQARTYLLRARFRPAPVPSRRSGTVPDPSSVISGCMGHVYSPRAEAAPQVVQARNGFSGASKLNQIGRQLNHLWLGLWRQVTGRIGVELVLAAAAAEKSILCPRSRCRKLTFPDQPSSRRRDRSPWASASSMKLSAHRWQLHGQSGFTERCRSGGVRCAAAHARAAVAASDRKPASDCR